VRAGTLSLPPGHPLVDLLRHIVRDSRAEISAVSVVPADADDPDGAQELRAEVRVKRLGGLADLSVACTVAHRMEAL